MYKERNLKQKAVRNKYCVLLFSFILILTVTVGTTMAFVMTKTPSLRNIFKPFLDDAGSLTISKTVKHPFGASYVLPDSDNLVFTFQVDLGTGYAGKTVKTSQGDKTADENGRITVTVKPGAFVDIQEIAKDTAVKVTELQNQNPGFSVKDEAVKEAVISSEEDRKIEFVNVYTPARAPTTDLTVTAIKELQGREWQQGDSFTFKLEYKYPANDENAEWKKLGTKTVICTDPADQNFNRFDFNEAIQAMEFADIGTYAFRLSETDGNTGGFDYSAVKGYFDVTVGDADMDGSLEIQSVTAGQNASVTNNRNVELTLTNTYVASGNAAVTINIRKNLKDTHDNMMDPAGYSFTLYEEDGSTVVKQSGETSAAGETAITLTYSAADAGKTFTYILKEDNGGQTMNGVIYDDTEYKLQTAVIDNLNGTISAVIYDYTEENSGQAVIQRNGAPAMADIGLDDVETTKDEEESATEETAGKEIPDETDAALTEEGHETEGADSFQEKEEIPAESDSDAPNDREEDASTAESTEASAENASLTEEESTSAVQDSTSAVEESTSAVEESAQPAMEESAGPTEESTPEPVTEEAVTGENEESENWFTLEKVSSGETSAEEGNVIPSTAEGNTVPSAEESAPSQEDDTAPSWTQENASLPAEENEQPSEDENSLPNAKKSPTPLTEDGKITEIKDNPSSLPGDETNTGAESAPVVTLTLPAGVSDTYYADFTNIYDPQDAEAVIGGDKDLSGRAMTAGEFTFHLYETGSGFTIAEDARPLQTTTNTDADGTFRFEKLTFDTAGPHYYVVKEDDSAKLGGITYDDTEYHVTIMVSDQNGVLEAVSAVTNAAGEIADIKFNNTYKADKATVKLSGEKAFSGGNLTAGAFTFELYDMTEGVSLIQSVKNDDSGKFTFDSLTFEKEGTWNYVVKEDSTNPVAGVTYDTTEYQVTIQVEDNGTGALVAKTGMTAVKDQNASAAEEIRFENSYTPNNVTVSLGGLKTLTGGVLKEGMFTFMLYETDASFQPKGDAIRAAVNEADGNFIFDALTYASAGTYHYIIVEDDSAALENIIYDDSVYMITITVKDNGNGRLTAEKKIVKDGSGQKEQVRFENTLVPEAGDIAVDIIAKKNVKSLSEETIGPEDFEFVLVNTDNKIEATAKSDKNGLAAFRLIFTQSDAGKTYHYTLSETNDGRENVTYSEKVYDFTIAVTEGADRKLTAVITCDGAVFDTLIAEFENIYEIPEKAVASEGAPTGDSSGLLLYIVLAGISVLVLIPLWISKNHRRKRCN